jgi:hypothetical protein
VPAAFPQAPETSLSWRENSVRSILSFPAPRTHGISLQPLQQMHKDSVQGGRQQANPKKSLQKLPAHRESTSVAALPVVRNAAPSPPA